MSISHKDAYFIKASSISSKACPASISSKRCNFFKVRAVYFFKMMSISTKGCPHRFSTRAALVNTHVRLRQTAFVERCEVANRVSVLKVCRSKTDRAVVELVDILSSQAGSQKDARVLRRMSFPHKDVHFSKRMSISSKPGLCSKAGFSLKGDPFPKH